MQVEQMSFSEILNVGRDEMKNEVLFKINELLNTSMNDKDYDLAQIYFDMYKMVSDISTRWDESK